MNDKRYQCDKSVLIKFQKDFNYLLKNKENIGEFFQVVNQLTAIQFPSKSSNFQKVI